MRMRRLTIRSFRGRAQGTSRHSDSRRATVSYSALNSGPGVRSGWAITPSVPRPSWNVNSVTMARRRRDIAVIGAGLMGHGIAQVFALAGHEVTIYDSVDGEPRQRQDTHPHEFERPRRRSARGRARHAGASSGGRRARGRLRGRGRAGRPAAQTETIRRDRETRAAGHHPRQQHLGHPDHQDHERPQAARPRARHPLVEPAVPGAAGRGDRDAMDEPRRPSTSP